MTPPLSVMGIVEPYLGGCRDSGLGAEGGMYTDPYSLLNICLSCFKIHFSLFLIALRPYQFYDWRNFYKYHLVIGPYDNFASLI